MTKSNVVEQILHQLNEVRDQCPDLRFGQLIATIAMLAEDETGHSLWDVEDAEFAAAAERFATDMRRRGAAHTDPGPAPATGAIASSLASSPPQPPRQVS